MSIARLDEIIDGLNECQREYMTQMNFTFAPDIWHAKDRGKKYIAIDVGGSGAFLVDKFNGEIYNIAGYGHADLNKKKKADIGNIATVDVKVLWGKRWNYLR